MSLYDDASLVMIPSGYKDGKLYSVKPSDGAGDFTFTRGSNLAATRVDENGLIEKGRENLLLQSNQFDTTWATSSASVTSGQSGYDGSSDAWLIESTGTGGVLYQNKSGSSVSTISLRVKQGSTNWMAFRIKSTNGAAWFNLSTGYFVTIQNEVIDTSVKNLGSGWYEISLTSSASDFLAIYLCNNDNIFASTAGNSIYIQDAQLEAGLVATDYIETGATTAQAGILEDMPRLDYSGGTCPALLLEPQRTNLVTQSEYGGGYNFVNTAYTANTQTSPEGLINASTIASNSSSGAHYFGYNATSITSGTSYSGSLFIKKGTGRYFQLLYGSGGFSLNSYANFDLQDGLVTFAGADADAKIIDYGNGWYRCSITSDGSASTNDTLYAAVITTATAARAESHTTSLDYYIYGAQIEAGSYATSYIPTYGTSVTRGADSCVKTGATSLIGQTEGTLYVEVDWNVKPESGSPVVGIVTLNNGANNLQNSIFLGIERQIGGINRVYCFVINSNVTQAEIYGSAITDGIYKIAFAYKANDFALYVNGSQIGTDTSGSVPTLSEVLLGKRFGTDTKIQSDGTKQAIVFKTRLSNTELAAITTI